MVLTVVSGALLEEEVGGVLVLLGKEIGVHSAALGEGVERGVGGVAWGRGGESRPLSCVGVMGVDGRCWALVLECER